MNTAHAAPAWRRWRPTIDAPSRRHLLLAALVAVVAVQSACLAYPVIRAHVLPPRDNPAQRGLRLASELGCFSCHGVGGRGGMPNPGSDTGQVPSFREGTIMMYARDDGDLRAYILDGGTTARRAASRAGDQAAAIRMPAFREVLSASQVDDLVAYLRAASDLLVPPEGSPAARGADVASARGCFNCHGTMGMGGVSNPGSLKGYIPGFGGADFDELVRDDDELRHWITHGGIERLSDDPLAHYFIERQRIRMPTYDQSLPPADVDALVAYVRWLAADQWRDAPFNQ
jgi:mono/diheme cytochrome c family protein